MLRVTEAQIARIAQTMIGPIVKGFVKALNEHGDEYEINTYLRLVHFIGQCAEETGGFNRLGEMGGTAYFTQHYEGRKDLGNTQPGDGAKFKGRGPIQVTGRFNYTAAAKASGLDLVNHPELAEDPYVGTVISMWWWWNAKVNQFSDKDDTKGETRRINGGYTNYDTRVHYINRAKAELRDIAKQPQTSDQPSPTGLPAGPPPRLSPRPPDDPGPVEPKPAKSGFFDALIAFLKALFRVA